MITFHAIKMTAVIIRSMLLTGLKYSLYTLM
jgi:hypothetical protein